MPLVAFVLDSGDELLEFDCGWFRAAILLVVTDDAICPG